MHTTLQSRSSTVVIGHDQPFCVIGERINPTGRKRFAEELRTGDLSTVALDARAQVDAGADMLDVNAGIPLVDESELLKDMLRTVAGAMGTDGQHLVVLRQLSNRPPVSGAFERG